MLGRPMTKRSVVCVICHVEPHMVVFGDSVRIIRRHGGEIRAQRAQREVDNGAKFSFSLPDV